MRLLGIDFGFKRIGIAIAEAEHGIISARPSMEASGALKKDAENLARVARTEQADAVILGLPLEDGQEGRMARICRTVGTHLEGEGLTVHLVDETLSSVEAERGLRDDGLKASERRKLKDGEAARLILQRYLDEQEVG